MRLKIANAVEGSRYNFLNVTPGSFSRYSKDAMFETAEAILKTETQHKTKAKMKYHGCRHLVWWCLWRIEGEIVEAVWQPDQWKEEAWTTSTPRHW
jgi:hypothetical protein